MRANVLVAIVVLAATPCFGDNKPIISASRIYSILADSANLAVDGIKFASQKTEASLSREMRGHYITFLRRLNEYKTMVVNAPPVKGLAYWANVAYEKVSTEWEKFEKKINPTLDNIILDFETRFPKSKWLIGGKLIDRILLVVWMLWLLSKMTSMVCCRRRRRFAARK